MTNAKKNKKVLFVCTGNTCRSSMAEAMLKALLQRKGMEHVEVMSAGTSVLFPSGASTNAVRAMELRDIDLRGHRSSQIHKDMIRKADLILTMTKSHLSRVTALCPEAADKAFTLKEFAYGAEYKAGSDISDPYGQSLESYIACADEIERCLVFLADNL